MTKTVIAGWGHDEENILKTQDSATARTDHSVYEEDAKKVMEFLNKLPSGTVNRVFTLLGKNR